MIAREQPEDVAVIVALVEPTRHQFALDLDGVLG